MTKSIDSEILTFLKRPENFKFALEVGRYAAELRQDLSSEFWEIIKERISAETPRRAGVKRFEIRELVNRRDDALISLAGYRGWNLVLQDALAQSQSLGFTIEEESLRGSHDIYIGLRWRHPVPKKDPHYLRGPIAELRETMLQAMYEFWEPEWICGRYILRYSDSDSFLRAYLEDREVIFEKLLTSFWAMVADYKESVDAVNRTLREEAKQSI